LIKYLVKPDFISSHDSLSAILDSQWRKASQKKS